MKQFLSILGGVIIIVAVALFAFRSDDVDEQMQKVIPSPSQVISPIAQNEFVEIAPSSLPDVSVPPRTSLVVSVVNITIDDEGFTPVTSTIPLGTPVVFTNNGQALHWPASDPHPVHNGLPGFDAKQGLATGSTYSYTFTKTGTFGMHDHLNTSMKGSIVVE